MGNKIGVTGRDEGEVPTGISPFLCTQIAELECFFCEQDGYHCPLPCFSRSVFILSVRHLLEGPQNAANRSRFGHRQIGWTNGLGLTGCSKAR
jgi:hypothetical protein